MDQDHPDEHEEKLTLEVDVWVPDHAPRMASARYVQSHHHLVTVQKLGCYICGSHEELETHHRIEWSFANAIDWDRVKGDYPDAGWEEFANAADYIDSPSNLIVLCADHHRHKDRGIHNLPHPIWLVQRYVKAGFKLF